MKALAVVLAVLLVLAHPVIMLAVVATVTALSLGAVVTRIVVQPASELLGVNEATVRDIWRGRTWKHVTGGKQAAK